MPHRCLTGSRQLRLPPPPLSPFGSEMKRNTKCKTGGAAGAGAPPYLVAGVEAHVLVALLAVVVRVVCRVLGEPHPCRLAPHVEVLRLPVCPSVCTKSPALKDSRGHSPRSLPCPLTGNHGNRTLCDHLSPICPRWLSWSERTESQWDKLKATFTWRLTHAPMHGS